MQRQCSNRLFRGNRLLRLLARDPSALRLPPSLTVSSRLGRLVTGHASRCAAAQNGLTACRHRHCRLSALLRPTRRFHRAPAQWRHRCAFPLLAARWVSHCDSHRKPTEPLLRSYYLSFSFCLFTGCPPSFVWQSLCNGGYRQMLGCRPCYPSKMIIYCNDVIDVFDE